MQDLAAHHAPLHAELVAAAERVLASGRFILGSAAGGEVSRLEEEAADALHVAHAVGVSSGTDALLVILMAAGVGPGDEVVTTPFSFIAGAGAIARLGARPVFADVDRDTLTLDPDAAVARIGPRTRAVLTVHLHGRVARTAPLEEACARRGIALLEDAAQAISARSSEGTPVARADSAADTIAAGGTKERWPGAIGRAAALSFFPTKILGGFGDGGMVLTNDGAFAERARVLRVHGATARFHHVALGGNFRLDELQAALLRVKLPRLPGWIAARRRIARRYREALAPTPLELPPPDPGCVWSQFVVRAPDGRRDALARHLRARGVQSAVYYPEPLHLQPCFGEARGRPGSFPEAERACQEVLALPIYPELSDSQLAHVTSTIADLYRT